MTLLWGLFQRTTLGALVRSIALNREISESMGTNAPLVSSGVFALGTGAAGIAGVLSGPILSVYPTMCFDLLMPLFVCRVWRGLPQPRESQALKWLRPGEMTDLPMPPADLPLVAFLRDYL